MRQPILRDTVFSINGGEKNEYTGTGFLVHCDTQAAYVVTCAHVVRDIGESEIIVAGFPAKLIGSVNDPTGVRTDLAVLSVVELRDKRPLHLRRVPDEEEEGKPFWTYGYDKELGARELQGTFQKQWPKFISQTITVTGLDLKITEEDYSLEPGYSGSPVVDDSNHVVAVVQELVGDGKRGRAISVEALVHVWPQMPDNLFEQSKVGTIENKTDSPRSNDVAGNSQGMTALQFLEQVSPQTYSPRSAGVLKHSPGKTLPQLGGPGPASSQANPSRPAGVVGKTEETIPPQPVHPQTVGSESASTQSRPTVMKENPPIEAQAQSMQNQPIGPRLADIQTLQKRVVLPFQIIAGLGFIGLIIDIVLAVRGSSPIWWIWISCLTVFLGGGFVAFSLDEMSPEKFSKIMTDTSMAMFYIFFGGGFIGLIIDIVLAVRGHSPAWWIWTITIGTMVLGLISVGLNDVFEKNMKQDA